jgi:hypothetical protein
MAYLRMLRATSARLGIEDGSYEILYEYGYIEDKGL